MEAWPEAIPAFPFMMQEVCMALFVGIDVAKDKFDACAIDGGWEEDLRSHRSYGQEGL
jgi:hypothetical protein